jgi:hypothetical protein
MGPATRFMLRSLKNSTAFLRFLSKLSGIDDLHIDSTNYGSGCT